MNIKAREGCKSVENAFVYSMEYTFLLLLHKPVNQTAYTFKRSKWKLLDCDYICIGFVVHV